MSEETRKSDRVGDVTVSTDRKALSRKRDELAERLAAIQRDIGSGLDKDYEEQSIQLENLEVLQEIARVTKDELRKVELRLADLEPGD
jgi:hypothetical protein